MASTAKKLKAVAACLSERNQGAAAIAAGMSVRSLRDLQSDPEFISLLADAKAHILASTTNAIVAASIRAVEVLHEALDDINTPAISKQWAVSLALNLTENAHVREALEARIAQLENTAKLTVEWEVMENKPKTIEGDKSWPRLT
jgi:hypothetical protein